MEETTAMTTTTSEMEVMGMGSVEVFKLFADQLEDDFNAQAGDPIAQFNVAAKGVKMGSQLAGRSMLYLCKALALSKNAWEEMGLSDQHAIAPDFYTFANGAFGTSTNSSTVDNYVRVGRTWFIGDGPEHMPGSTYVFELDTPKIAILVEDEPGDEDKEAVVREVEFNPWEVQYSKLLSVTSRALRDKMEEADWGLLMNSDVTQDKLMGFLRTPKSGTSTARDSITFFMVGGFVTVTDGRDSKPLFELDEQLLEDPLAARGWERMKSSLGILDEEGDEF